jgi:hypothetical protein
MHKTLAFAAALLAAGSLLPQTVSASVTDAELAAQARAQDALPHRVKLGVGTQVRVLQNFSSQHAAPRIIENGQAPLHDENYVFVNQFDGVIGNQIVNVYAGYYRYRPTQGVFMVTRSSFDFSQVTPNKFFNGPSGMGALKITKYDGGHLVLTSEHGPTVQFPLR